MTLADHLRITDVEAEALSEADRWGRLSGPRIIGYVPTSLDGSRVRPGVGIRREVVEGLRERGFLKYAIRRVPGGPGFVITPRGREALAFYRTGDLPLVRDSMGRCCAEAAPLPCVCAYSWECPKHGTYHVGSHD